MGVAREHLHPFRRPGRGPEDRVEEGIDRIPRRRGVSQQPGGPDRGRGRREREEFRKGPAGRKPLPPARREKQARRGRRRAEREHRVLGPQRRAAKPAGQKPELPRVVSRLHRGDAGIQEREEEQRRPRVVLLEEDRMQRRGREEEERCGGETRAPVPEAVREGQDPQGAKEIRQPGD